MTSDSAQLVVVLDDSDEDREALARALRQVAPDCALVRFGVSRDLFEYTLTTVPLFVLLDLNLSHENGLRVLHRLRSHPVWRVTPVVIYSGSQRPQDISAAYAGGAAGYLLKSFDRVELARQVEALWAWWAQTVEAPCALTFAAVQS